MSKQNKRALLVALAAMIFTCCLAPLGWVGYTIIQLSRNKGLTTVKGGTVNEIASRSQKPGAIFVSPGGHWMVYSVDVDDQEQWLILDIQTGQERLLELASVSYDIRWLNEEEFIVGSWIVKATDLAARKPEWSATPDNNIRALEVLRGANRVYLLPTRGTAGIDVVSGDPDYPYGFDAFVAEVGERPRGIKDLEYTYPILQETFPETEFIVIESTYFQPLAGVRNPDLAHRDPSANVYWHHDFPSPDGRFYVRRPYGGTNITIYQCGQKEVAYAVKNNWSLYPKGWAYDSSGFYFLLRPKVGWFSAGEVSTSILKLNLPPDVLANAPPYEGEGFCE